jgi:hypothetical protein
MKIGGDTHEMTKNLNKGGKDLRSNISEKDYFK